MNKPLKETWGIKLNILIVNLRRQMELVTPEQGFLSSFKEMKLDRVDRCSHPDYDAFVKMNIVNSYKESFKPRNFILSTTWFDKCYLIYFYFPFSWGMKVTK